MISKFKHVRDEDGTYTIETIDEETEKKERTIVELLAELNKPFKLNRSKNSR